jgi:ABC-type uncharacterized transport system involved in gliding motility auxiliary subunit
MKLGWLKARQTKYAAFVSVYIVVILGVLAAANFLANRYNKSYDATKNKRYSLSDQTDKVVKNLKQDVTITCFDRDFERARDLLGRYSNLSHRLKVQYIDPVKNPTKARAMGARSDGTIILQAGSKREEAKSLTEEEITGALIRALKTGERNVCVVSGSGERSLDNAERGGLSTMKQALEKNNYTTRTISLIDKPEVPKDCTVLVTAGPKKDYTDPEVNAIKTYVENGGRALFLLDPPLNMGRDETTENPALAKLLADWGVALDKDLVLDMSGIGQLFGLGPEAPLVTGYESQPIVREMKGTATVFPIVRSLEAKSAGKTSVEKLFASSAESYATSNLSSPEIRIDPKKDKKGPLTLGAAGTYTGGKPGSQGRFVVVGSSTWVANSFLAARQVGNRDLFLNMMNWLSSDEDLISIRPKEPEDQSFAMTAAQRNLVWYWSIIVLPLAVIVSGGLVWWKRR